MVEFNPNLEINKTAPAKNQSAEAVLRGGGQLIARL